ncbi:serine/threonine-protein kinase mos [Biomphalaria glabrata]|nr:serine/threonine-protein kinase mos [Biomphalaria glabrata]
MLSDNSPDLLRHVLIKRLSLATIDNPPLPEVIVHRCRTVYDSQAEWTLNSEIEEESSDHSNGNFSSDFPSFSTPANLFASTQHQAPAFHDNRRYFSSADPPRNPEPVIRSKPWPCPSSPLSASQRSSVPVVLEDPLQSCNQQHYQSVFKRRRSSSGVLRYTPNMAPSPKPLIRRCDIIFGSIIGKGAFGQVYKGLLHGRPVAIKVVQKRRGSGIHREILQAERLAFSMNLRHENIVNVLGVNMCEGSRGDALIVMELVSTRTLQSVLDDVNRDISLMDRLRFASEIARAIDYLHVNNVVHLDVKPRNVLMTEDDRCKLADFGSLTQTCSGAPKEDVEYTQLLGTLAYRAPELMNRCYPSNKADIYSLGITLWQLVSRETPHIGANPHWLIYQVVKANKRPPDHYTGDDVMEIKYKELYTQCWDSEPMARPSATEVLQCLANLKNISWQRDWIEKQAD